MHCAYALNAQSAYRLRTLNLAKYMDSTHFYGQIFVHIEYTRSVHCVYDVRSIIFIYPRCMVHSTGILHVRSMAYQLHTLNLAKYMESTLCVQSNF